MPVTISCPLSGQAITDPVIYKGYIYDRPSLLALVLTGGAPEGLTKESIRSLPIDYFTEALLKFSREHADCDTIPVSDYQAKKADSATEENVLDQIYEDPIHYGFPVETVAAQVIIRRSGVLCAVDGRLYQRDDIEKLTPPFTGPVTRAPLNLKNDFLVHPVYQHLIASLEQAERAGKPNISLRAIFNNFSQPEVQRIAFPDRPYVSSIFKDLNTHLAIGVMAWYMLSIIAGLMFKSMLFTPLGAAALFGSMAAALLTKDGIFSARRSGVMPIRMLHILSLMIASVTVLGFLAAIVDSGTAISPLMCIPVVVHLAVAALQLLMNHSFFDKAAKFNSNKSSAQIRAHGVISLVICLLVTAALGVGVFFTLSSLPFTMTAVVSYLSLAIATPAIFNTLYQTIYNLRCSDFFAQLFSGNINLNSFKGLLRPEMVGKVILIVMSACLLPSLFPVLGLLGTSIIGISAFLMALNLFDFRRNSGELEYRKAIAAENARANTAPLAKIELREINHSVFLEKISQLRSERVFSINADSSASELVSPSVGDRVTVAVTRAGSLGSVVSSAGLFGSNEVTPLLAPAARREEVGQLRKGFGLA